MYPPSTTRRGYVIVVTLIFFCLCHIFHFSLPNFRVEVTVHKLFTTIPSKIVMKTFTQLLKTCSLHSVDWADSDLVGLRLPSSVEKSN